MKKKLSAVLALLALGAISNAQAGLIGDSVTLRYLGQNRDSGTQAVTVGAGEDGNFFNNQFFDFDDSSFSIRSSTNFCGIWECQGQTIALLLGSLDLGAPITNVSFTTNLSGVGVSWTGNSVTFNWLEQALSPGTYLSATFTTGSVSVPEPGTMALWGLGLAALGFALRRKQAPRA